MCWQTRSCEGWSRACWPCAAAELRAASADPGWAMSCRLSICLESSNTCLGGCWRCVFTHSRC